MCAASWAMTPMISPGVSAAMIAPVLMNIRFEFDHEGVEALVDDEEDLDVAGLDVGLSEDRRGVVLEQRLGLGVAGDVDAGGECRLRGERRGKQPGGKRTETKSRIGRPGLSKPRRGCYARSNPARAHKSISALSAASEPD